MSDGPFQQKQIGAYAPQTAREVLDHVRYMQRTGFVPRAGVKLPQNPAQALPLYFRNVSGSTMPAYACMQITGTVEIEGQNYASDFELARSVTDRLSCRARDRSAGPKW